jgi:adenylate cyclase
MAKDRLSRKLAVILHADVVGSTSLVQQNETLAHERIQAAFQKFSETIKAYGGITRELRGDALVAEFERASDAVAAAIGFQAANGELNATLDDGIQPELRIGISLGEVIIADNTITGAGVVLAQRLEQLAIPGGVVVQGSVSETVPDRMPFEFETLGEQVLKGFDQPVRAFSAKLPSGENLPAPDADETFRTTESGNSQVALKLSQESYQALTGEFLELPDKPSIAVLPFQNMSDDPGQEYFADGMSEDIITALSKIPDLVVISRISTFVYKGRAIDARQVGRELAVAHVLEGSIRKVGDRIRITAQLVDTQSNNHVWAERYDRKLEDIFAIQDEITHNIVVELNVKLIRGENARLIAAGTNSLKAWELTIRSEPLISANVRDDVMTAIKMLKQALELDDGYSAAWALLGWAYWQESTWKWCSDPDKSLQMSFDAAHKAISADANYYDSYSLLGFIHMVRSNKDQAIEMSEKAVELAPGNADAMANFGFVLCAWDREKEGLRNIKRAVRLCPFPPAWYLMILGAGLHLNGDNETSIPVLKQAVDRMPDSHIPLLWLACALVEMGRPEDALAVSKAVLDIEPTFIAVNWTKNLSSKLHARTSTNLIAAGFPK